MGVCLPLSRVSHLAPLSIFSLDDPFQRPTFRELPEHVTSRTSSSRVGLAELDLRRGSSFTSPTRLQRPKNCKTEYFLHLRTSARFSFRGLSCSNLGVSLIFFWGLRGNSHIQGANRSFIPCPKQGVLTITAKMTNKLAFYP